MSTRTFAGQTVEINEQGFLLDSRQWTPAIGEALAHEAGLPPLTTLHWRVITLCREEAARTGRSPRAARLAKLAGLAPGELAELFPKSPETLAARVAGLPRAGATGGER